MYSQKAEQSILKMIVGAVADGEKNHLGTLIQMDIFTDKRLFVETLVVVLLERGYICKSRYFFNRLSTVSDIFLAFVQDDNEVIADLEIGLYPAEVQRKLGSRQAFARLWRRLRDGDGVLVYENHRILGSRVLVKDPKKALREYEFDYVECERSRLPGLAAYEKRIHDAQKAEERKRQEELAARHYDYTWAEVNELGLSEFRKDYYQRACADRFAGFAARNILEKSVWGYAFPDGKFVPTSEIK